MFAVGGSPAAGYIAGISSVVPRTSTGPQGDSPLLFGVAGPRGLILLSGVDVMLHLLV